MDQGSEQWRWQVGDTVALGSPWRPEDAVWGRDLPNMGQILAVGTLEDLPHRQEDLRWYGWPPQTPVAVVRFVDGRIGRYVRGDAPCLQHLPRVRWEQACRVYSRSRERMDRAFSPWQLADEGLDEAARQRWLACVAARRAGHLRLLAQRLIEREDAGAAPMRCDVLHPLFRGPALELPDWMRGTGSLVARPDAPRVAGDSRHQPVQAPASGETLPRRRRLAAWATRVWLWRSAAAGLPATLTVQRPLLWLQPWEGSQDIGDFPAAYHTLRRVVAAREDLRWRLQADSAPLLVRLARHLERRHGLDPQPALWFDRPKGWLHGAARDLTALLFGRKAGALAALSREMKKPLQLDWLAPRVHPDEQQWPQEVRQAVILLRERLGRIAGQRGVAWSEARATVWNGWPQVTHIDDTWCRWRLETLAPFERLDSWIDDARELRDGSDHDWLPIPYWPDASPAQRGPGWRRLTWFEPGRPMIRWRSKAFARRHPALPA